MFLYSSTGSHTSLLARVLCLGLMISKLDDIEYFNTHVILLSSLCTMMDSSHCTPQLFTRAILLFWTGQLLSACVTFEFVDSYVKWRCRLLVSFCICIKLCNNKCNSLIPVSHFLDAFAKLRKVNIKLRHVCTSVCLHGTARLTLDGFSWNYICKYWTKICQENSSFIKIWQE